MVLKERGFPVPRSSPYTLPGRLGREQGAGSEVRVIPAGLWSGAVCTPLGSWYQEDGLAQMLLANLVPLEHAGPQALSLTCSHLWGNRSRQHVEGPAGGREGNLWDQGHWGKTLLSSKLPVGRALRSAESKVLVDFILNPVW